MEEFQPLVYIVIPNKNGILHLSYSLKSLAETNYKNYKVLLVDNGSSDDSLSYVRNNYNNITVLINKGKPGFAGGANTGIKYALKHGAKYIAIFSNDIQVLAEWLNLALPIFKQHINAGIVGFTEITRDKEQLFFSSKLNSGFITTQCVNGVGGCLMLCSVEAFMGVGLLDEDYYMYGEDNDLFFRFIEEGFDLVETNIPVWHYGEGSSQQNSLMPVWLSYRNAIRFALKNESFVRIIRVILSLANQGCNPFMTRPLDNPSIKRLRRFSPFINIFLILGACLWNLWNIRATVKARSLKYEFRMTSLENI
jgi:GT2 family glycosyltransferase